MLTSGWIFCPIFFIEMRGQRNMKVSFLMDRQKPGVTKSQPGFIDFVVRPLFETWGSAFFFVIFLSQFSSLFLFLLRLIHHCCRLSLSLSVSISPSRSAQPITRRPEASGESHRLLQATRRCRGHSRGEVLCTLHGMCAPVCVRNDFLMSRMGLM